MMMKNITKVLECEVRSLSAMNMLQWCFLTSSITECFNYMNFMSFS